MHKQTLRDKLKAQYLKQGSLSCYTEFVVDSISHNAWFLWAEQVLVYSPRDQFEIPFVYQIMRLFPQKHYFFPLTDTQGVMTFYEVVDISALQKGRFGIQEPEGTSTAWAASTASACIFVPAVAISHTHTRLGWGKGCYDRFLSKHPSLHSICVVPDFAYLPSIPLEPHDIAISESVVAHKD